MAWIKDGKYYQISYRLGGRVHTSYIGAAAGWFGSLTREMANEHETMVRERREWRAARRIERQAAADDLAEVRERVALVDTLTTGCLAAVGLHRPRRYRWRKRRMIEIEYNPPANLADEAREIVKSLDEKPKSAMRRALINRLEEIGKTSPQAVLGETNGDVFQLLIYIFAGKLEETTPDLAIGLECKLRLVLEGLIGDSQNTALRLAAEVATFAYLEVWMANLAAENHMRNNEPIHPALDRRQTFTQRRFLRALESVEQIRAPTRPKRIAMEI